MKITKKIKGIEIAKAWREVQAGRLARLDVLIELFEKSLKSFSISEKELDKKIKEFKKRMVKLDLEDIKWKIMLENLTERETE
jgi:hypothetical protein